MPIKLLSPIIVISHLLVAFILVAITSSLSQVLKNNNDEFSPLWWRIACSSMVGLLVIQSVIGSNVASHWSAQKCLAQSISCQIIHVHKTSAMIVGIAIFLFSLISLFINKRVRKKWPYLLSISSLTILQIFVGKLSLYYQLNQPILIISHQLIAIMLVSFLSAMCFMNISTTSNINTKFINKTTLNACHG